jgi:phosphatidylserine decarboxylase
MKAPIVFWNRKENREEVEKVYGDVALQWVYGTRPGQVLADQVLSRGFVSQIYGAYQSSKLSRHKIAPFIRNFQIPMDEYVDDGFRSFNDFFIRKFRPGARVFTQKASEFPAFAEARYYAYENITQDQKFPIKGTALSAAGLLGNAEKAKQFEGGPVLLARLCPTDYHRFHFPDDGKILESYPMQGRLHSVNPLALQYNEEIFMTNERYVSLLQTKNFGLLAYIEVGALCVGRIVQTFSSTQFSRGQEKGYFLFGGSTVIVLGQPGTWKPDSDLVEQTAKGRESLVRLGEKVATSK